MNMAAANSKIFSHKPTGRQYRKAAPYIKSALTYKRGSAVHIQRVFRLRRRQSSNPRNDYIRLATDDGVSSSYHGRQVYHELHPTSGNSASLINVHGFACKFRSKFDIRTCPKKMRFPSGDGGVGDDGRPLGPLLSRFVACYLSQSHVTPSAGGH